MRRTALLKELEDHCPFPLDAVAGQAVLTRPENPVSIGKYEFGKHELCPVDVLYINSPPWLFENSDDELIRLPNTTSTVIPASGARLNQILDCLVAGPAATAGSTGRPDAAPVLRRAR
jgi:hypothetical protein